MKTNPRDAEESRSGRKPEDENVRKWYTRERGTFQGFEP
jgi:hypothetical protein